MAEEARRLFQYEAGKPVGFHLHHSIKNEYQRETLTNNILAHGGKVLDSPSGADTVLVDEKKLPNTRESLQTSYSISRDAALREIVVEPMRFVQDCIRRQVFTHTVPARRGMGGYVGRTRTDYTKQDDDNLCWLISRKIPNPADGGRVSLGVYKELLLAAEHDPSLAWAKRHTAESWRERYKKNRERLDPIIARYAAQYPPEPPALYNLSRRFNKNPKRALKFTERFDDDIIELTDESEEDRGVDVKPQRRRSPEKDTKPSKRRRIDSSDLSSPHKTPSRDHRIQPSSADRTHVGSSPQNKGKGKAVNRLTTEPEEHEPFDFAPPPSPDLFAPGPSQPKQPLHGRPVSEPRRNVHETPAPSPTLVRRSSPTAMLPPPLPRSPTLTRVNLAILPSPHPSTSFRNVAHSSPIYVPSSANRSGLRSNDTSATEPSSRSMVVPPEFAPSANTINAPAESSITRESSHKRSSPVPPPMRKASRKQASRQPPVPSPVGDGGNDQDQGQQQRIQWAPYKNTRSRSRSVEPVLPLGTRKRKERNKNVPRNTPLAPVHEGEADQEREHEEADSPEVGEGKEEQEGHQVISTTLTETIQEERSVANLLMLESNSTGGISGTIPRASDWTDQESGSEESSSEEETEEEGEGEKLVVEKKEEEETDERGEENSEEAEEGKERVDIDYESEQDAESGAEGTAKFETAPEVKVQSHASNSDDEIGDVSSVSFDLEGTPSIPEDEGSIQDIPSILSSDLETLSRASPNSPRRPFLDDDDAEIDQMLTSPSTAHDTPGKTAREVLALYDSSPEVDSSPRRRKRKPFNKFRDGSPSPLRTQNQNRPRGQGTSSPERMLVVDPGEAAILARAAAEKETTKKTPAQQVTQKLTGSARRVSYGSVSSAPLSSGSLPRTPAGFIRSQPGGSQSRSSLRNSFPQSQPQSQSGRPRHNSLESTSSEMASFPINGTRASAVKQQAEQEMKNSPYTPPSGTKAAELVARRLRPRKRE
ncbi:hypothetical protein P691DRAFT_733514 [Macrolepiota fuliginosa MF-IS2]|uniref:BRCT domain-containing protein n=1 Tax=Macrolepiota fuliginosa MF-IS2 TaxID=1400762 RepID=A0A9P5XBM5_9AGAR|nr:hypothetical protein P691DRAFT_733514 [Macrolepiota fuliginosa MF-IS2]